MKRGEPEASLYGIITILPGDPRPSAVVIARNHGLYRELTVSPINRWVNGYVEFRVEVVGHTPCGWEHPTWPDEAAERLRAHKSTCELREEGEDV